MFIRSIFSITMVLGATDQVLNLNILTQPPLGSNTCAKYGLASRIAGLGIAVGSVPFRRLQFGYNTNLFNSAIVMCNTGACVLAYLRH